MAKSSPNRKKTKWEKEKLLVTSNFSFSHFVFKRLVLQTRNKQGLFGKGLNHCGDVVPRKTLLCERERERERERCLKYCGKNLFNYSLGKKKKDYARIPFNPCEKFLIFLRSRVKFFFKTSQECFIKIDRFLRARENGGSNHFIVFPNKFRNLLVKPNPTIYICRLQMLSTQRSDRRIMQ